MARPVLTVTKVAHMQLDRTGARVPVYALQDAQGREFEAFEGEFYRLRENPRAWAAVPKNQHRLWQAMRDAVNAHKETQK